MAAAQADDFALDWDLPEYPQLPKMFTSAKAAKKRKHKEFILTDADLDTAVKIPKAAAAAAAVNKAAAAAGGSAGGCRSAGVRGGWVGECACRQQQQRAQ